MLVSGGSRSHAAHVLQLFNASHLSSVWTPDGVLVSRCQRGVKLSDTAALISPALTHFIVIVSAAEGRRGF